MISDERLANIEMQLARQDDLVETLNKLVYRQQKKIDELEALCAALARHVKDLRDAARDASPADDKPPHY
ncbi:SlyX protein [Noviherbaspirillum humi]|uniref:SlyX protein n=1 Tax=Noviherbaspirillum humi TaxID=1688639 RepID=A0A239BWY6_9BURK|nr:SlyX family protein [Noviherbaspirillum humi]SNS12400.1 SlyX protein [Noviherbaspirillum humi]